MSKIIPDKRNSKDSDNIISENEEVIKKLNSELSEKNVIISRTKSYLFDLEYDLNKAKNKISSLEEDLVKNDIEIKSKDDKIQNFLHQLKKNEIEIDNLINQINSLDEESVQKSNKLNNQISSLESNLVKREMEINNLINQIESLENELKQKDDELHNQKDAFTLIEKKYVQQSSKLDTKEYCISCYEEKILEDTLEIEYFKKNVLIKKLLNPFIYLYLVFKSKPNEISINFKLYNALRNSKCFDVGYYLNNNDDLIESKWFKYFSLELHYICNGFAEGRKFNKKYFNRSSKKELLDYILKCTYLEKIL